MVLAKRVHILFFSLSLTACLASKGDGDHDRGVEFLEPLPISVSGEFLSEVSRSRDVTTRFVGSVQIEAGLERIDPGVGGTVFIDVRSNRGDAASLETSQGSSTIDNPAADQVNEAFYAHSLGSLDARLRVGLLDGNSEFAALDSTAEFLNPAPATSPAIAGIPTWPFTAPGAELVYEPDSIWSAGAGLYDNSFQQTFRDDVEPVGSGSFAIGEVRATSENGFRGIAGAWHNDGDRASGTYVGVEQAFGPRDVVRTFGLAALASGESEVRQHAALGIESSPFRRREQDSSGLMISRVDLDGAEAAETAAELYYRAQLTDAAAITVSVQAVQNPAGEDGTDLLLGLRGSLTF